MINFYQKLKKILTPNSSLPDNLPIKKTNKIIFEILDDGNIEVNLHFKLSSDNDAKNLGEFLYDLNTGQVSKPIMDLMIDLGNDYPEYADLIKNSMVVWLTEWTKFQNENGAININEDQPLVLPTEFSPK